MFTLENVFAGYGGTVILRDVSLALPSGSVAALLGPNGAGKTTLLRVASGLLRPTSGTMTFDGVDVTGARPHQLAARGVCHVPEGRAVFPSLTVRENLALSGRRGTEALEKAVGAFPRLGERLTQLAGTMSGGEQQMLALARAYVSNPDVMLLDEVSMGLAPKIVDEIFEFLGRVAREGASLLLVEQYVSRALALADFVYLLDRGQIVFRGEPSELDGDDVFAHYLGSEVGHTH
ncbi:MAG TPA: ABC transporter ATP-binding protein [Acidimicrobiales bacterium]|jgi:branched-chain amino acid transport system ATP-binding protein